MPKLRPDEVVEIELEVAELVQCRHCDALIFADDAEQCFFCDREPLCQDCIEPSKHNCTAT